MQRRTFLQGIFASGVAGLGINGLAASMNMPMPVKSIALLSASLLPKGGKFVPLTKLKNESVVPGQFSARLVAAPVAAKLLPNAATEFWAYNNQLPGPAIEVMEGDTVEIEFVNHLSQPSTIHWHGLPVPPEQDGNPQTPVLPGEKRIYRFKLPDQCAGTYWYHPHPHEFTAEQAFRGLAGTFIVRAKDDPLAHIAERHLVLSDLKLDANGQIAPNDANDWMNGREGQFVLVNAQNQPVADFSANGRERWRMWNACSARYLRLRLPGSTFTVVGTDGGLVERPVSGLQEYLLSPGERVELIVDANTRRDAATLIADIYDRGKMGVVAPEQVMPLLTVDFSGVTDSTPKPLPGTLRNIAPLGHPVAEKQVILSEQMTMTNGQHGMKFLVNGKQYDMGRIDLTSQVNAVELWTISNQSDMDHPFHLHGTQFQVVERVRGGQVFPESALAWKDTVNLKSGETLKIKTIQHWPGIRMFHCHILEHEAAGMMGQLKVLA